MAGAGIRGSDGVLRGNNRQVVGGRASEVPTPPIPEGGHHAKEKDLTEVAPAHDHETLAAGNYAVSLLIRRRS